VPLLITLSNFQSHAHIADLLKWNFLYSCAAVDNTAFHGPSMIAELLVPLMALPCSVSVTYEQCVMKVDLLMQFFISNDTVLCLSN